VAWIRQRDNKLALSDGGLFGSDWTPLYTAPPQRKPLTDYDIYEVLGYGAMAQYNSVPKYAIEFTRAIEKAHGIS
jgi:hypothetical protein